MATCMESNVICVYRRLLFVKRMTDFCHSNSRYFGLSSSILDQRKEDSGWQKESEFRTYEIQGLKPKQQRKRMQRRMKLVGPPRYKRMSTEQDWTDVWPTATTFKWSAVPLPVRQGFAEKLTENEGVSPGKYGNAELMKIPNFLHLTPAHIKKHCQAIKKFCTKWPKGLKEKDFPMTVITSDYCFAGPSVRDPRARVVSIKFKLSALDLDYHARDKFLRLVQWRYNRETDVVTITTDRCPMKKQNYDYAVYLLTALYYESQKTEPWEADKTEADMDKYYWDKSQSHKSVTRLLQVVKEIDQTQSKDSERRLSYLPDSISEDSVLDIDRVQEYKDAVSEVINDGETDDSLLRYKESVKKMLNIEIHDNRQKVEAVK